MKVLKANALPLFKINVCFDDGVVGDIDLTELIQKGIFKALQDPAIFRKVYTTGYSIAWSEDLEIDAITIYSELTKTNPNEIVISDLHYASN